MKSKIGVMNLIAFGVPVLASADEGGHSALHLSDFQRVLRTGLDSELVKIADAPDINQAADIPDQRGVHSKRRYNMRRRTNIKDSYMKDSPSHTITMPSFSPEHVWNDLVHHAWDIALTIKRNEHGGLSATDDPQVAHPCPFFVCSRGRKEQSSDTDSVQDIIIAFEKDSDESLLVSSSHNETCLILTTTAFKARQVMDTYEGSQDLAAVPLLDITKIHAGTVDEVSSEGWSVPYHDKQDRDQASNDTPATKNETEAMNEWERIVVVDFVPGLGGMKEEAQLLDVVNSMMSDIQDMAEVGWLRSMDKDQAEEFVIDEFLGEVPALSDIFSITSSLRSINDKQENGNPRIKFWQDAFKNGMESEHACSDMFSTLFVKPGVGYYSYDLVLNPGDGPPPQEYDSSASNPACVTSLIAALSTHPYVLSVKANFPIYHGWHIAQKLDSF